MKQERKRKQRIFYGTNTSKTMMNSKTLNQLKKDKENEIKYIDNFNGKELRIQIIEWLSEPKKKKEKDKPNKKINKI